MSAMDTITYRASGGASERRLYKDGEGLTIESQDAGFVLAWSSLTHAHEFLDAVSRFVETTADTEISPQSNGRAAIPLAEAMAEIALHPDVEAIQVESKDETFLWTATDPTAGDRLDLSRVVLAFSALDHALVRYFISRTAAPEVKSDLRGIMRSAEHVTDPSSSIDPSPSTTA